MNKKTITLVMMALLAVMGVKADVIPVGDRSVPGAGHYYIQNVKTGKYFNSNSRSVQNDPYEVAIYAVAADKYIIAARSGEKYYVKLGNAGNYLWNDDTSGTKFWSFNTVSSEDKTYTISSTVVEGSMAAGDWYLKGAGNAASQTLVTEEGEDVWVFQRIGNKQAIINAKGNATSLITDPAFDIPTGNDNGWAGGTATNCQTWRGGDRDYENGADNVTFTQTLSNMPAGTYKLVAAVRGANGTTATANLNGTSGTTITNHEFNTSYQQINLNGVQMPYSSMGGFNTGGKNALGWQWASVTYTLAADGDLTLNFVMTGAAWKGIDDVHLYYMSDGTNEYAMEYTDGINNTDHVVPCDLQTDNPNKIFTATSNIYTASGAIANNLRVSNGFINNLVLYDGYEVSIPADTKAVASKLYRNIAADAFATICCPFQITGGTGVDGTFYQPASLTSGTLNFETVDTKVAGKSYLYKATSAVSTFTGPKDGTLATTPVDNGSGVVMKGTFTNIAAVPTNDYVLSGTNLYKVNSTVSCSPFRAYFNIPDGGASARIALNFDGEDATGITLQEVESESENAGMKDGKYFENGRIVIVKNGVKYSVNGSILK